MDNFSLKLLISLTHNFFMSHFRMFSWLLLEQKSCGFRETCLLSRDKFIQKLDIFYGVEIIVKDWKFVSCVEYFEII